MSGPQTPVTATDLSGLDGFCPVLVNNGHMEQKAVAMTQDTFLALIELYRGKDSKAGRYASSLGTQLNKVATDLILRREAGLLDGQLATTAVDETIFRFRPDGDRAFDGPLGGLTNAHWASYSKVPGARAPYPHPTFFGKWVASLINEGIYSRLCPSAIHQAKVLQKKHGGTIWQNLSDESRAALIPAIQMLTLLIQANGWQNADQAIKAVDQFYPRFDQGYKRPRFA